MQQVTNTRIEIESLTNEVNTTAQVETVTVKYSPIYLSALGAALLSACGSGEEEGAFANKKNTSATNHSSALAADTNINNQSDLIGGYDPADVIAKNGNSSAAGFNNFPIARNPEESARFLLQTQFNVSDTEIIAVNNTTFANYLQQQFNKPVGQTGWDWLEERGYGVADTTNLFHVYTYPAEFMLWNQLFNAQDAMRKRIALGLSEYFVVSLQDTTSFSWKSHAYAQYWDLLVKNAFGNFRQLLEDVTLSPAMGVYLNTRGNLKENPATGRIPDENYGREVMQLFTIGLHNLNLDGTDIIDGNNNKVSSYSQEDVTNISRVFTGYNFDVSDGVRITPIGATTSIVSKAFSTKPMAFNAVNHTALASTFLSSPTVGSDNTNGIALKKTLDILFNHPNVGPFFGKQMIQKFVTSNPSPAYVARVASAFNNNGAGVRGDLKAVWTAIFLDDEARRIYNTHSTITPLGTLTPKPAYASEMRDNSSGSNRYNKNNVFGKLREPMLRFIQWGRTFGITSAANSWKLYKLDNPISQLGQSPFQSPSVFNFFRPDYVPLGSNLESTQTMAPEFQIANETTVCGYLNYMQSVIRLGILCYDATVPQASSVNPTYDIQANYANESALASDPVKLVNRLNLFLAAGQISPSNQSLMVFALTMMPINSVIPATQTSQKMDRVAAAVLMVMACSEYLIQK